MSVGIFFLIQDNKMIRICYMLMSFALLVAGTAHETPQQVLTRYNNYKAICSGMGFENVRCKETRVPNDPYPIAFQSSLLKNLENMRNQETVVFGKASLNEGNAYNKTSGIFTAPSDGIYSFTWTILTKSGKYFVSEIALNYIAVAYNHADGRGREGNSSSSTSHANIKMKKGDKVWIRSYSIHGQYAYAYWSYFSGEKL